MAINCRESRGWSFGAQAIIGSLGILARDLEKNSSERFSEHSGSETDWTGCLKDSMNGIDGDRQQDVGEKGCGTR